MTQLPKPAAQQPSDLVRRLRALKYRRMSLAREEYFEIINKHLDEAADRIEALEAASREQEAK